MIICIRNLGKFAFMLNKVPQAKLIVLTQIKSTNFSVFTVSCAVFTYSHLKCGGHTPFKAVVMFAFRAKYFSPKSLQVLTEGVRGIKPHEPLR